MRNKEKACIRRLPRRHAATEFNPSARTAPCRVEHWVEALSNACTRRFKVTLPTMSEKTIRMCEQRGRPSRMQKDNCGARRYDPAPNVIDHAGHCFAGVNGIQKDSFGPRQ